MSAPSDSIILIELFLISLAAFAIFRTYKSFSSKQKLSFCSGLALWIAAISIDIPAHFHSDFLQFGHNSNLSAYLFLAGGIAILIGQLLYPSAASSRAYYYRALASSLDTACLIVSKNKIVSWNSRLTQVFEDQDSILGKNPWDLWGDSTLITFSYEQMLKTMSSVNKYTYTSPYRNRQGQEILLGIKILVLNYELEEFLILVHDATEEHKNQQRSLEHEIYLERAQKIAGLAYWHIYLKDRIHHLSCRGIQQIFDLDNDSPSIETLKKLIHPSDVDDVEKIINRALKDGVVPKHLNFRILRADGEMRHLHGQIATLNNDADGTVHVIGVVQDTTETVRGEDRLRHAQKMEAVGELTGGLSHDFNNLLHVILGNLELIQDTLGQEDMESANAIKNAAERGSELTQRLLAFSRKQILDPKSVNVNDCLDEMLPLLRRTLGEAIHIEAVSEVNLSKCKIDSGQLENSILNLAINAQHAMPEGGTLKITTHNIYLDKQYAAQQEEVKPGHYVQLSISDTGMGMPEQILDRVFEPFFTTKEVGKGSGLGLSMVYGFIKQSGGHISIQSKLDEGTTVNLFMPVSTPELVDLPNIDQDVDMRFSGKVLLVEDDIEVAALTRKFLESVGLEVVPARHAREALLQISEHKDIKLLLSDVILPGGIHGPKLAEQMLEELPDLKVLFMSGYSDDTTDNQGIVDRGVSMLHKPFRKTEMIAKLHQTLSR